MYHVELRQFPRSARAFNLAAAELAPLLAGWRTGRLVRWGEDDWEPRKAKLTILEGPALAPSELGMGRGWPQAQRHGREVTAELLVAPEVEDLRPQVLGRCDGGPVALAALAAELGAERTAVERAVWALLLSGELELLRRGKN